jgi:hypothetical protein
MPVFEGKILTISSYLTNLAVALVPGNQDLIARRVFQTIPMKARKMKFLRWDNADWNRPEGKELANREAPPLADFSAPTEDEVKARKWGVATNWTDDELSEADNGPQGAVGYETKKVRYVTRQALLRLELDFITLIRTTTWGTVLQGTTSGAPAGGAGAFLQWDDVDAEPIALLKRIIRDMGFRAGVKPNIGIFPGQVLDTLTEHPAFLNRVTGGATTERPAAVNVTLLAGLLGLEEIIEAASVINTAKEGEAANNVWAWGQDVWIGYRPPAGQFDEETPAPGYLFNWTGAGGARPTPFQGAQNDQGIFINRFNSQRPAAYWAESYLFSSPRTVAPVMGVLLKDAIAARPPL